jgi:hypothetical protein
MSKLEQLLAQRAAVDEAITAEQNKGRDDALATVRNLCKQYGITTNEVKEYLEPSKLENSQSQITIEEEVNKNVASPKLRLIKNEKISLYIIFTTSLILNFVSLFLTNTIPSNSTQWLYFLFFTIGMTTAVYIVHYFYSIYGAIIAFVCYSIYLLYGR